MSREDGWLLLVAPPWIPYAPALVARGIRLSKLVVVDTRSDKDTLWAAEQSLRAGNCSAVLAWPAAINERSLRRLQLAAEEGGSFGAIFGAAARAAPSSPAPLRMQLGMRQNRLTVRIIKRRGSGRMPTLWLDVSKTARLPPRRFPPPAIACSCRRLVRTNLTAKTQRTQRKTMRINSGKTVR